MTSRRALRHTAHRKHRRHPNRGNVTLVDHQGAEPASIRDGYWSDVSRNDQFLVVNHSNESRTWKLPLIEFSDRDVRPRPQWKIREADGTLWEIISTYLRGARSTYECVCVRCNQHQGL